MLRQPDHVTVRWRAAAPRCAGTRARILAEIRALAWDLARMEALLHEAHQAAESQHPWLAPRLELRLPLFDLKRRLRLVLDHGDLPRIRLLDEKGQQVADVRLL